MAMGKHYYDTVGSPGAPLGRMKRRKAGDALRQAIARRKLEEYREAKILKHNLSDGFSDD